MKISTFKKYGYVWVTLIIFILTLIGHWYFSWQSYISEQLNHNGEIIFSDYIYEVLRDTFENWQSEFLQLIWQVAGLSFLWFIGSPQSKENSERQEEKIDKIFKKVYGPTWKKEIQTIESKYPKK